MADKGDNLCSMADKGDHLCSMADKGDHLCSMADKGDHLCSMADKGVINLPIVFHGDVCFTSHMPSSAFIIDVWDHSVRIV